MEYGGVCNLSVIRKLAMPVHCSITFPRISDEEMRSIDYRVMEHVFATHNEIGRLADELVYHKELLRRLLDAGINALLAIPISLQFRDFSIPLEMDLVVEQKAIYELKTVATLLPIHFGQLVQYIYLSNATHGKLVNFRTSSVETRFVNTTLSSDDRRC